jgi:hypothetical protein
MKLNPLTQKISKHFSIHPSRQNTMAAMIFSVLCSNNVHHQSLARYVDSPNPKNMHIKNLSEIMDFLNAINNYGTGCYQ